MGRINLVPKIPGMVAVGLVLVAFWQALFGGGSLVATDVVQQYAAPFEHHQNGTNTEQMAQMRAGRAYWPLVPTDTINIHSHWAAMASDVRSGEIGWWNGDLAAGQPTMKGGLPIFNLLYLLVPAWFAPGLVAAVRTLVAVGLTYGFVRSLEMHRLAALVGAMAFGFSGFMVGWMNWPHSSVAALAPGLLWATERLIRDPKVWRALPLAALVASMVWANFPQLTIYVLLAGLVYVAFRLPAETLERNSEHLGGKASKLHRQVILVGLLGALIAVLFAAPHVIGFFQYLDWADTSYRDWGSVDSAAGAKYFITALAPALWGHVAFGPIWFGEVNWIELNAYVGASVLILAALGMVLALANGTRRQRAVVGAALMLCFLGIMVGYVGGPLATPFRSIGGDLLGSLTRAKIFWHLGIAMAAALGTEHLLRSTSLRRLTLGRAIVAAMLSLAVLFLAFLPSAGDWLAASRTHNALRGVLEASRTPLLCAVILLVVVVARSRNKLPTAAVGWGIVGIVGFELLSFTTTVIQTSDASERINATPAHAVVSEALDEGERLSGAGWTFFPATTALFGIDDARGQLAKSSGYNALYRAEDPNSLTPGHMRASPVWPYVSFDADISSPVWDAMAVGVWAQFPDNQPPGSVIEMAAAANGADPSQGELVATYPSPQGGLRAVLLEIVANSPAEVELSISAAGQTTSERRFLLPEESTTQSFAFLGEDLPPATPVEVRVSSNEAVGALLIGVDNEGQLAADMVAGDDDLRLIRTGDVLLTQRPNAHFVRLANNVTVEPDPQKAAQLVAARDHSGNAVVLDRKVDLTPTPDAKFGVLSVETGRDRVDTRVETNSEAVVVFSIAKYPGWQATVNGEEAEILTADAAFMAVTVPSGSHVVTLQFVPQHLRLSLLLMGLGLLISCYVAIRHWRNA